MNKLSHATLFALLGTVCLFCGSIEYWARLSTNLNTALTANLTSEYEHLKAFAPFLQALGGAFYGIMLAIILDSSKNVVETIKAEFEIAKGSIHDKLNSTFTGELKSLPTDLEKYRDRLFYFYFITTTDDNKDGLWACAKIHFFEKCPFALVANFDFSLPNRQTTSYRCEAFIRKDHLVIVIMAKTGHERPTTLIFPAGGVSFTDYLSGIGIGQPNRSKDLLRSTILSPTPLVHPAGPGPIDEIHWNMLNKKWQDRFDVIKRLKTRNGDKFKPFTGYWISLSQASNSERDIALIHLSLDREEENIMMSGKIVYTDGHRKSREFTSTMSSVDSFKLTISYQNPAGNRSIGTAVYFFKDTINDAYDSYTGFFIDDSTSSSFTVVAAKRISIDGYERALNQLDQMDRIDLSQFSDIISSLTTAVKEYREKRHF